VAAWAYWIFNIVAGLVAACWCFKIVRTDFCGLYQAAGAVIAIDLILGSLVSLAYFYKSEWYRPVPVTAGGLAQNNAVTPSLISKTSKTSNATTVTTKTH